MRVFCAYILSLLLLLPVGIDWVIYFSFKAHQGYIAEYLCENRMEPLVMCSGACYLGEQLQAQHEEREDPTFPFPEENRSLTYLFIKPALPRPSLPERPTGAFPAVDPWSARLFASRLFRPPRA